MGRTQDNGFDGPAEGFWDCTNTEYHADRMCVSHSTLEVFRDSIPLYHGRFVAETIPHPPASQALQLGSAFHTYLLERHLWSKEVAIMPEGMNRRSNASKKEMDDWLAEQTAAGVEIIISCEQYEKIKRMFESAMANAEIRTIVEADGVCERALRWQCRETGLWLKCRFDKLLADTGRTIVNVKTAADPTPWAWSKQAYDLGYYRQEAFYCDGRKTVLDADGEHLYVVVGNDAPFEAVVYKLGEKDRELGRRHNLHDLHMLAECRQFGIWDSRYADRVVDVSLPAYAHSAK